VYKFPLKLLEMLVQEASLVDIIPDKVHSEVRRLYFITVALSEFEPLEYEINGLLFPSNAMEVCLAPSTLPVVAFPLSVALGNGISVQLVPLNEYILIAPVLPVPATKVTKTVLSV